MVFVIAEVGVNHNGKLDLALQLVDAAIAAGADAVKFQTFKADLLASKDAPKAKYQENGDDESQLSMLQKLELSRDDFLTIKKYCDKKGITFFSTPFDLESVDVLEEIGVDIYKIGSADLTNYMLLEKVVLTNKRLIISTGASTLSEVEDAVKFLISKNPLVDLCILHCVSSYPTEMEDLNLRCIQVLSQLGFPVGFSDHTTGYDASVIAVSLGALVIEKHITLSKMMKGPDHSSSMDPEEFKIFVERLRQTEVMLGDGIKSYRRRESDVRFVARRSLAFNKDLEVGKVISKEDLIPLRPASGICSSLFENYIGKTLLRNVYSGKFVEDEDV